MSCKPPTNTSTNLFCVLLKQAELKALIQLELAYVPGLVELLSGGVQFVQQLGDPWHQALGVYITHPTAAAATAAATTATASAVAGGKGLTALDTLEQPDSGKIVLSCYNFLFYANFTPCQYQRNINVATLGTVDM